MTITMWCNRDEDHPAHGECPGLPYPGYGLALASAVWNAIRPDRDALAAEADGTGPEAAAARHALRVTPEGLTMEIGSYTAHPAPDPTPDPDGNQVVHADPYYREYAGPSMFKAEQPAGWVVPGEIAVLVVLRPDGQVSVVSDDQLDTPDVVRHMHGMADTLEAQHRAWVERGIEDATGGRPLAENAAALRSDRGGYLSEWVKGMQQETAPDGMRYLVASDGHRYGPFPPAGQTGRAGDQP